MIASKYINSILSMLCDGDEDGLAIRPQLPYLIDDRYDYTAVGLFVYFRHTDGIQRHRYDGSRNVLYGVKFRSSIDNIEGEAQVFVKDGFIDYLEIWCYSGSYPKRDLLNYVLTQEWGWRTGKELRDE